MDGGGIGAGRSESGGGGGGSDEHALDHVVGCNEDVVGTGLDHVKGHVGCSVVHEQVDDGLLDGSLVGGAVALAAGTLHGGATGTVEHFEVDAGSVGSSTHETVEGVHFADQSALADATDGRVAGHFTDGVEALGQFLEKLVDMKILSLHNNRIEDVAPVKYLVKLQSLYLSQNRIKSIASLRHLGLKTLILYENQITDLSTLQFLFQLQTVSVGNSQFTSVAILQKLTQLKKLSIPGCSAANLALLEESLVNTNIEMLGEEFTTLDYEIAFSGGTVGSSC